MKIMRINKISISEAMEKSCVIDFSTVPPAKRARAHATQMSQITGI